MSAHRFATPWLRATKAGKSKNAAAQVENTFWGTKHPLFGIWNLDTYTEGILNRWNLVTKGT